MFTEPTVFILGAGASWHYGYPTGERLIKLIHQEALELEEFSRSVISREIPAEWIWTKLIYERSNIGTTINAANINLAIKAWHEINSDAQELRNKLEIVNPLVIDYFLGDNPKLQEIGNFLIAKIILQKELSFLRKEGNSNRKNSEKEQPKDDWVRFIAHKLLENCESAEELKSNKVDFITFNYDLSLERLLYKKLSNIEKLATTGKVEDFFSSDRIIHMYGEIGKNFREDIPQYVGKINYANDLRKDLLKKTFDFDLAYDASSTIRTISAKKHDDLIFSRAQQKISEARNIFILGYGFDELNNSRLGLKDVIFSKNDKGHKKKAIYFTNYEDKNTISKRLSNLSFGEPDKFLPPNFIQKSKPLEKIYYEKSVRDVYEALEQDFDL